MDKTGILAGLFERRFHVSQTPPAWVERVAGYQSTTGLTISENNALELSAVWACIRVLAETIGQIPFPFYRRVGDGKERARDHPLYAILDDMPNPEMDAFTFRETLMGHLCAWGNAYADIEIDRAGRIKHLWPLRPDKMKPARENGRLVYNYRLPKTDRPITLPAERIFHLHGLGFDGLQGYNPIRLHRQTIGLAKATEDFGSRFFANDARPGAVLQHPGTLSEDAQDRLRKSYEKEHRGLEKSHRMAILEEGMTIKEIGIPPEDAQYLGTRKFQVPEICRIFRVPPHMVHDLDRATWGNIEHQAIDFVIYSIGPWVVRWEKGVYRELMLPSERPVYFAEFLLTALLRGDTKTRYDAYSIGRQNGWLSANDIRRLENMDPLGPSGDVYLVPLNMIPADQAGLEPSTEPGARALGALAGRNAEGETTGASPFTIRAQRSARMRHRLQIAYQKIYRTAAGRIVRREVNDVLNGAKKIFKRRNVAEFDQWLTEFYEDHREFIAKQIGPVYESFAEAIAPEAQTEVGATEGITPELGGWIANYVDSYAARHTWVSEARIREVVRKAIAEGEDPAQALEAAFDDWPEKRPAEIGRRESVRFGNALAVAIYVSARRIYLRWYTIGKTCPYCRDLNGKTVGIKEFFLPAGSEYQPEGAERPLKVSINMGHPPAHDGCDCLVVAG